MWGRIITSLTPLTTERVDSWRYLLWLFLFSHPPRPCFCEFDWTHEIWFWVRWAVPVGTCEGKGWWLPPPCWRRNTDIASSLYPFPSLISLNSTCGGESLWERFTDLSDFETGSCGCSCMRITASSRRRASTWSAASSRRRASVG